MEGIGSWKSKNVPSFAKGLHVLAVDHHKHSLQSIASMLQHYSYKVTTAEEADAALRMISKEKDDPIKLVMANLSIHDKSSLSFLHLLLQMDITTILMIPEGDCMNMENKAMAELGFQFLKKPISMEDIELVWQYVYRKNRNPKAKQLSGKENGEENVNKREKSLIESVKIDVTEEDDKKKTKKRSRIVWNSKLHCKFTEALSKLGNKKSSPKIILKMMNEPTLTLRQVASHLQKYKSQVKRLNMKANIESTATDTSNLLTRIQLQQLLAKQNNINCFNPPKLPFRDVLNFDLRMLNHNHSVTYGTSNPIQPETCGGFEAENYGQQNGVFEDSQDFVQYFTADVCNSFSSVSADNQCSDAIQRPEFAQNLDGCFYSHIQNQNQNQNPCIMESIEGVWPKPDLIMGVQPPAVDSVNQNEALKELYDLQNNTGDDPMAFCSFDGELNLADIDQYYEWLNT